MLRTEGRRNKISRGPCQGYLGVGGGKWIVNAIKRHWINIFEIAEGQTIAF